MSPDFELLMKHVREHTAEVELDLPAPLPSGDPVVASQLARSRRVAINRGDRVARAFKLTNGHRAKPANGVPSRPELEALVTDTECRKLVEAGAKWVGSPEQAPATRPYVEQLRVHNYRCVKDVTIPLTALHAFIGPNDSGKSTLLDAMRTLTGGPEEPEYYISAVQGQSAFTRLRNARTAGTRVHHADATPDDVISGARSLDPGDTVTLHKLVSPVRSLRLDPDAMRAPSSLIPQGQTIEYDARGAGLAAVYDALLSRQLDAFLSISKDFKMLFPTVRAIQLTNPNHQTKALAVELIDGTSVSAQQLSEGMLYWLAFAALPYLYPASLLLIEEPENGLHPSRIAEVMRVLREISRQTQIIIATHSPLVINELQADEVTLIRRPPEQGTVATPLSKTKNFEQRSKVYALGELWLNYADGDFEQELVY